MKQEIPYIPDEIYDSSKKPYDPMLDNSISKDDKVSVDYVVTKLFKGVATVLAVIFLTALILYSFPSHPPIGMLLQINEAIITPNIETYPLYVTLAGTHVSSVKSNNTSKEPFDIRLINDRVYDNSILHARLIVIAPSGVDVRASGYSMDNDATVCQIKYELKSGMVLYTPIHVIADRAGTYPIDGKLEYWFSSDLSDQPTNNTVIMYASFNNTFRVISP